ncbi:putative pex19 protein [Dioscorea sansibarensis]
MADDLDQLLDSALEDFSKADLGHAQRSGAPVSSSTATVQGLGMGLPELKAKKRGKERVAAPVNNASSRASEALEKLTQQTREAVRGLESVTAASGTGGAGGVGGGGLGKDEEGMVEEFVKQFEQLAESQDVNSIVETMMQQLLSKEILQEPMKEIGERYPKWLEEHKNGLSLEEYESYHHQYEIILKLNEVYEHDPNNYKMIVDLMQKIQQLGHPPDDIIQELAPAFDLSNLDGQLNPELPEPASDCCIM